jgi:small subunit ribosomal protein S3
MGHKVHPIGFRLGIIHDWQAKWYADKSYTDLLQEDLRLRQAVETRYRDAGIARVDIERQANQVTVTLHTSRPGIVIGRGGQRVDETRVLLEELTGKKVRLNIQEIRQPELDARLVSRSVAEQIERRIAFRRAMKQTITRTMQSGAKGIKIICSGRLAGAEIARQATMRQGRVPLHTLRADIDFGISEAHTTLGLIGVKVWIYKGEVLPERKVVEADATAGATAPAPTAEAVAGAPAPASLAEAIGEIESAATEESKVPQSS